MLTADRPRQRRRRWAVGALFAIILLAFAVGIWGTLLRDPAYEVRGEVVTRAAPDLLVVRHEAIRGLGMTAMDLMVVTGPPTLLDQAAVVPGDRVRLGVRRVGDQLSLVSIEKVR